MKAIVSLMGKDGKFATGNGMLRTIVESRTEAGLVLQAECSADSASAVQPERCCLDYPRCDCNSPPEPDNEWHCSQYPGCECFAGCREKALEAAP